MVDAPPVLHRDERRSLALARLMASRAAWRAALAPSPGTTGGGGAVSVGWSAGLWLLLAQGRHWLRALGAEGLFDELREQLRPWIRRRPGAAMAIAALMGAGLVGARPWAHRGLWRALARLPWAAWAAEAAAFTGPLPPRP
ncbi:MAG: hypothetical protein U1F53_08805 [Burkholderiaceae bacterium]